MVCSMSRKGDCWDNAPMESFFGSLKTELGRWPVPDPPGRQNGPLRLYRRLLQSPATALGDRLRHPDPQRTTRRGRVGRNPCPPNRGKVTE